MDIIDDILKVDNTEIQLTQEEAIRYLDIWKSVTRDYKIVGFIDATEEAKRLLREFRDRIEPEENRMIKVFTLFFDYWCYFRFEDGNALNCEILLLLKKILTQHPVAIEMDKRFREKWQKICDSDSEDESLHIGEDTEYSEELDRLREENALLKKELQKKKEDRAGYLGYSTTERAEALQILLEKALGRKVVRDDKGAFNKIYSMIAGVNESTTGRYIRGCKDEGMFNDGRRKKAEKDIQALLDAL